MDKLIIPVLLGTARKDNNSQHVARFVHEQAQAFGFESELVKVGGLQRTDRKENVPENWSELMSKADGLIIVSPEYNHGYPGELKMFLDSLFPEYKQKAVGICGVSAGILGGARMIEQIKPVLIELGLVPTQMSLIFPNISELLGESKTITDESYKEKLEKFFGQVRTLAGALKIVR